MMQRAVPAPRCPGEHPGCFVVVLLALSACSAPAADAGPAPAATAERWAEVPVYSGAFPTFERERVMERARQLAPDRELPVRGPLTAAAECASLIHACFEPETRNWAGCFENAPRCSNETPWIGDDPPCCPAACAGRYQELRRAGMNGPTAVAEAIWGTPSCAPGLDNVEGEKT